MSLYLIQSYFKELYYKSLLYPFYVVLRMMCLLKLSLSL